MNETCARFVIPAGFIAERVVLDARELAWGFEHLWIRPHDAVALCTAYSVRGYRLDPVRGRIAELLSDQVSEVREVLGTMGASEDWSTPEAGVWLYLSLAFLYAHQEELRDPYGIVEDLYSDFDQPEEAEGLVRYMPLSMFGVRGLGTLERQWLSYLVDRGVHYRRRVLEE